MNWDDLRYVLAVARTGSALRAGRALGVNQTTVLRRLDALECALGSALFERGRAGQVLTAVGQLAAETAERMEREAEALTHALAAHHRSLKGSVRLTTSESLAMRLVVPCMPEFRSMHPDVSVELITADERLDIARGDADVALRAGSRPEGAGIVARRLPDNDWTVYCSRAYAEARGTPHSMEEVAGHDIVVMEGKMGELPASQWLARSISEAFVRFRSNSMVSQVSNLRAGLGVGVLPTLIGDAEPELVRCFPPAPEVRSEMWLIVREDVKARPHIRAFTEFLTRYVRQELAAEPQPA